MKYENKIKEKPKDVIMSLPRQQETHGGALTDADFWISTWESGARNIKFNPYKPSFIHFHRIFKRHLPAIPCSFFEVGCFPGQHLWYFSKFFGYRVSGIEYMPGKGETVRKLCAAEGINADVISGDFFNFTPAQPYDIVGSFGFIEHFDDTHAVTKKHLDITRPGGVVVITVPNHASPLYNRLLWWSGESLYNAHKRMSLEALIATLMLIPEASIVASGYCGHFGLGYTGTMASLRPYPRILRLFVRIVVLAGELLSRIIPDNRFLSQAMFVVIRRKNEKS